MELRQRKRINNLPRFDSGVGNSSQSLFGTTQGIGGDITGLQAYRTQLTSLPTNSEINSIKAPKANTAHGASAGSNIAGNIGAIASMGNQDIAYTYNTFANPVQARDLMAGAGTSSSSIHGVNYQQQNNVNSDQLIKENNAEGLSNTLNMTAHGASAGMMVGGPIGGAIGGVLGLGLGLFNGFKRKSALRKAIWNANQLTQKKNIFARSGAYSEALQNDYYQDYGDTRSQLLNANRGKN